MRISNDLLLAAYESMLKVRFFEEKVLQLFATGELYGTTHLDIGQEGVVVGETLALRREDCIVLSHRNHGATLAKGADVNAAMAELFGRETGLCKGRGGSLHFADRDTNNLGGNGIVGGGAPIATGAALASKMRKLGSVVLCALGDGAMQQGVVHEAMNVAANWSLPVVFVCTNNLYGMSTPLARATKIPDLAQRAKSYGFSGVSIDGNDVLTVFEAVYSAARKARSGLGPSLIVCDTYRWTGHSKSDKCVYRTAEEVDEWKQKCPIARLEITLRDKNLLDDAGMEELRNKWRANIENAVEYARSSPLCDPNTLWDEFAKEGTAQ